MEDQHKAIFMGKKSRKVYWFGNDYYYTGFLAPSIKEKLEYIEDVLMLEKEIDNPPLEINEKIHFPDLNETLIIKNKARHVEGGFIYWLDYNVEIIDDETTKNSLENAKNKEVKYKKRAEVEYKKRAEMDAKELIEEVCRRKIENEYKQRKKWYQFWK